MGGSLSQLTSRQLECVKSELAEVIIAHFCYPTFLDYRVNRLRTRPVDRRKRQEVWAYVNGLNFGPLDTVDAASMEFRRFVERVFLRAIEMNRALLVATSERQIAAVRARVPQLAAQVARGLADYLMLGEASEFGRARPIESWASAAQGYREPTWEQIEKSTQLLQTTLVYLRMNSTDGAGQSVAAKADQRDNKLLAVITAFPTQLLVSPSERFSSDAGIANGAMLATAHDALGDDRGNGVGSGTVDGTMPPQVLLEPEPGPRRQFQGPVRSPTASRPLDAPLLPQAKTPGGLSPDEALHPQQLSVQPMAPEPEAVPVAPPEVQPSPSPDAWQALLLPESQEHLSEPALKENLPASSAMPDDDLLALPESFGAPHLFDLPPDLAELYGDYLRDSRAASLDPNAAATQKPVAASAQAAPYASPAAEIDEEIDALFTALTNKVAELEEPEWAAIREQSAAQQQPMGNASDQPAAQVQSDDLRSSQESELSLHPDKAVSSLREHADDLPARQNASRPLSRSEQSLLEPQASSAGVSLSTSRPLQPVTSEHPQLATIKVGTDGDVMIFSQLQHQIFTWLKMAAVSHQIDLAGRDAAELVAELRRVAALDEAELQVIESLVAICQRVAATKRATIEDFKQAMMLYLLHHRSRLAL